MRIDLSGNPRAQERADRSGRSRHWRQLGAAVMELTGGKGEIIRQTERSWASVTFCGTRHTIAIVFADAEAIAAGEAFVEALPEHEFTLPGYLVADATVIRIDHTMQPEPKLTVEIELLLLEEG